MERRVPPLRLGGAAPPPRPGPAAPASPGADATPLWRDAVWSGLGEFGYAGGVFVSMVLLARLGSVQALGRYTLGMAIATPIILLTNLHLRPAFVVDPGRWPYARYLGLRLWTLPLSMLATGAVALAGVNDGRTVLMILAVGGVRAWESLSDILVAPAQKAQRMASIGRSRALRGIATAGGLGLGLVVTGDALVGMGVALALLALLGLGHDRRIARRFVALRPERPRRAWLPLVRHTLPIGLAATALAASVNVPAYALERAEDVTALGYFGAMMSVVAVGNVLNVALGNAAIPRLARRHQRGAGHLGPLLARLLAVVLGLNGALVLGVFAGGALYLRAVYGEAYAAYTAELELAAIVAALAGLANMMSQAVTAMGRFGQQLAVNLVALGGSLAAAGWLVPGGGLRGAMLALLVLSGLRLTIYAAVLLGPALGAAPRPASRPSPRRDRDAARAPRAARGNPIPPRA